MTNELEKQFFDTFNIEPIGCNDNKNCTGVLDCTQCPNAKYLQITDRMLLELILINMHHEDLFGHPTNTRELKDNTLKQLIETYSKFSTCITCDGEYQQIAKDIKHQVRTLFEDE